ncbi:MAG TPA: FliI/YscN family ATPase [Deltaproteobacteria bacterium]|nr:FliI/YscN family ATPase [Deltaproteobacteria bacterium]
MNLHDLRAALERVPLAQVRGRVTQVVGPLLEAELPRATLGALCTVGRGCPCEVVGFRGDRALLVPLEPIGGVSHGDPVEVRDEALLCPVGDELLGRILDGLGRPVDDRGPILTSRRRPLAGRPRDPLRRDLISAPLETGVRVIDGLLPVARGQRISITAGSGVGKSTLLGMLARWVDADVVVACLVGERGREVREFLEHNLGPSGRERAVLIVSTSDESPALQIKAPQTATAIAEHFRDTGRDVLLLVDSLTRLALAQRQVGLAAGEPPTTRGYTPSVFALLPPLLERAGAGEGGGSISAFYTVLVEGDDEHDPIADAVRGILDGHIVLSRAMASRGQYPAVDVLASLSRVAHRVSTPAHAALAAQFRRLLAVWRENEELVRLGAYKRGASPDVDEALARYPAMQRWLQQDPAERVPKATTLEQLADILG